MSKEDESLEQQVAELEEENSEAEKEIADTKKNGRDKLYEKINAGPEPEEETFWE